MHIQQYHLIQSNTLSLEEQILNEKNCITYLLTDQKVGWPSRCCENVSSLSQYGMLLVKQWFSNSGNETNGYFCPDQSMSYPWRWLLLGKTTLTSWKCASLLKLSIPRHYPSALNRDALLIPQEIWHISAGIFREALCCQWFEKLGTTGMAVFYPHLSNGDKTSGSWLAHTRAHTTFKVPSRALLVNTFRACISLPVVAFPECEQCCLEIVSPCSFISLAPRWQQQCPCHCKRLVTRVIAGLSPVDRVHYLHRPRPIIGFLCYNILKMLYHILII